MSYALTEQFLAQCLAAQTGMELKEAAKATTYFLEVSRAMSLITAQRLDAVEQDARILHLAGQGVPRATIAIRLSLSRSLVFMAIKRHQGARRAALKAAS